MSRNSAKFEADIVEKTDSLNRLRATVEAENVFDAERKLKAQYPTFNVGIVSEVPGPLSKGWNYGTPQRYRKK